MKSSLAKLEFHRFAGVSLSGGKTDRTAVAVIEYYPQQKRIFLRSLREKVRAEGDVSADQHLHMILTESEPGLEAVAFDVPLQLPKCMRCQLKCPGVERCKVPEIKWMWEYHRNRAKQKRPHKLFTPYTERCAEMYISSQLEEPFHPSHAMGSNAAPLTARAIFLARRFRFPMMEVYPKLAIWRIGRALKIGKSHLRFHAHSVDGDESRLVILKALVEHDIAFIYQQDMRTMVENNDAFEAFICALVAFLKFRGQTEKPPAGYPRNEAWIEFPKESISWF
ncbi:MAG: DUF429 domain-containing protein [Bdellovibrionaceae bacterium]|nr:DUF429 domain-containing protein [Pseudobdellovibrionaceae bacterium]